jgi:hypothetical protein
MSFFSTFKKITSITHWCLKNKFEALVLFSIIAIFLLAVTRIGSTGTWADTYHYLPEVKNNQPITTPAPRKDSQGELRTRAYLESRFKKSFPKSRPDFMVNPVTGSKYNLELDCYNPELRLAVEYNGAQHYVFNTFFHKNKEAFYNQKYRDELKRLRCKELGITLIEIPYTEDRRLEQFLEQQLRDVGL